MTQRTKKSIFDYFFKLKYFKTKKESLFSRECEIDMCGMTALDPSGDAAGRAGVFANDVRGADRLELHAVAGDSQCRQLTAVPA